MRFVETGEDVKALLAELSEGECFLHLVWRYNSHPIKNEPLALLIQHYTTDEVYVVSFSHPDVIPTKLTTLRLIADTPCKKYVMNRKDMLHLVDLKNCVDIGLGVYSQTLKTIEFEKFRYKDIRSVPIMRIIKSFKDTSKLFSSHIKSLDMSMIRYETDFSVVLKEIEESGIYVSDFTLGDKSLVDENGLVYSQYNMFTPAGRPSNRFGGVNYAR